jgi:hypothetical protein
MSERQIDMVTGALILCCLSYAALCGWIFYEVTR